MSHRPRTETAGCPFTRHSTIRKATALRVGFYGELPGCCFRDSCMTWCGIMPCAPSKRMSSGSAPAPRRWPRSMRDATRPPRRKPVPRYERPTGLRSLADLLRLAPYPGTADGERVQLTVSTIAYLTNHEH